MVTTNTYDSKGLATETTVGNSTDYIRSSRGYDSNGMATSVTDARGKTVTYTYDNTNNTRQLTKIKDPKNNESTYTYGKATADKTVDASIRSYTGIVKLTAAHMSVTIKLAPKCTKILGDANSDGKVNMYDALLVDAYSVDNSVEIHLCVSDVNGDEKYNMWDALEIDTYSVTEGYIFSCEKA